MKRTVWYSTPDFSLISYGNGVSFLLVNKTALLSVHFQDDDARQFQIELEGLTDGVPAYNIPDALALLWNDYSHASEPAEATEGI